LDKATIQRQSQIIPSLAIGTSLIAIYKQNELPTKLGTGCVKGDFQARFRENVRVRFLCVIRLAGIPSRFKLCCLMGARQKGPHTKMGKCPMDFPNDAVFSMAGGKHEGLLLSPYLNSKNKLTTIARIGIAKV